MADGHERVPFPHPVDAPRRRLAAGVTMAVSFNCIEIPASKCAAKFVNKSTSQPARSGADPRAKRRFQHALKRSPTFPPRFPRFLDKRAAASANLYRDQ